MHSSRMHTACLLPVSSSMHSSRGPGGVGGLPDLGGVPGPGPKGVPGPRRVPAQVLPPVDRMTDRRKSITLPQTSLAGGKNVGRQK